MCPRISGLSCRLAIAQSNAQLIDIVMVQISPEEVTALATAFKDTAYVQANGFTVGGDKFFAIRADDRSIYGKKVCEYLSSNWSRYISVIPNDPNIMCAGQGRRCRR